MPEAAQSVILYLDHYDVLAPHGIVLEIEVSACTALQRLPRPTGIDLLQCLTLLAARG